MESGSTDSCCSQHVLSIHDRYQCHSGVNTTPLLLTGPPLSKYLLYLDITMNSQIIDFYSLFTSVIRIFHLSIDNPFVPRGLVKRGGTVLYS